MSDKYPVGHHPNSKKNMEKGRWKKGQITNPLGIHASAHYKEKRRIKRMTIEQVLDLISMILTEDLESIKALITTPGTSVFKVWLASVAVQGIKRGDYVPLWAMLDRVIGKIPTNVILNNNESFSIYAHMTYEEKIAEAERLRNLRLAVEDDECITVTP